MFDLLSNEWTELSSDYGRHWGEISTSYLGRTLVTDYRNGSIYNLTDSVYDDNGTASIMTITGRHLSNDRDNVIINALEIDMEHGQGLQSGQGSDPMMMIEVSKNGGKTFSARRDRKIGAAGDYLTRTRINRLGQSRDFVFRISISDPIRRAIIGAYVVTQ